MRDSNPKRASKEAHRKFEWTREKHKHVLVFTTVLWVQKPWVLKDYYISQFFTDGPLCQVTAGRLDSRRTYREEEGREKGSRDGECE